MNETTHSASLKKAATVDRAKTLGSKKQRVVGRDATISQTRESRPAFTKKQHQSEMRIEMENRMCTRCRINPVYLDIKTLDWCEPCIWEHSKE